MIDLPDPIKEKHDGVRRWAIHYRGLNGKPCTFYSDAKTMAGANAHFARRWPGVKSSHIRNVSPDEWLGR